MMPVMDVNLPPGAFEKVANQIGISIDKNKLKVLDNLVSSANEKKKERSKQHIQAPYTHPFKEPATGPIPKPVL